MWLGLLVFGVTYVLISVRRLGWLRIDRPTGALFGAVACVIVGLLTPGEAIAAVDGRTLLLLFGMMGMGAFLGADGFFERAGLALAAWAKTPARLLGALVWSSGILSALITNDAVCVLGAPLVVALVQRNKLPALPFLLALATSANTGSVATLVGNPQNMLCAVLGDLSYARHLLVTAPVAIVGLAMNHGLLWLMFRKRLTGKLRSSRPVRVMTRQSTLTLAVIGGTAVLYTLGTDLPWTAVAGCTVLLFVQRQKPDEIWKRVDGSVLLFFAGLFIVVEGLVQSGVPAWAFERFPLFGQASDGGWFRVSAIFLFGSNIVSNVPFILVVRDQMASLPDPTLGWELLAMASTFAGNLTLLGSVANIIVAEKGRLVGGMGFWPYFRLGFPLALSTTAMGTAWLVLVA